MINKNNIICIVFSFFLSLIFIPMKINAMNLLQPYNPLLRPYFTDCDEGVVTLFAETSIANRNYNSEGCSVNPLQIWQGNQNALAMLEGFPEESAIGKLRTLIDATDDGVRGHFNVCGDLHMPIDLGLAARWSFYPDWALGIYLPFFDMQLKNVRWTDLTQDITVADLRTKEFLTNDFFTVVNQLGSGLDLGGWHRRGVGDLTLMIEWFKDFVQYKPFLKNVRVNWRTGVIVPTGLKEDVNKLFAIPFGTNGAWGLPFEVGLDLTLGSCVRAGLDVLLIHTFGNTRCRRIKTDPFQTDLLFLQTAKSYVDFGLTQQYSLYMQLFKFYQGASFLAGYQYIKRGDSEISLYSNDFSAVIANTAQNLKDFTMHQAFLRFDYDFAVHMAQDASVRPQLMLFSRIPFNGKRSALFATFGLGLTLNF